jgi:hypothetical protein
VSEMGKLHFVWSPDLDLTPGNAIAQGMFRASFAGRFYPDLAAASPADVRRLDRPVPGRGAKRNDSIQLLLKRNGLRIGARVSWLQFSGRGIARG